MDIKESAKEMYQNLQLKDWFVANKPKNALIHFSHFLLLTVHKGHNFSNWQAVSVNPDGCDNYQHRKAGFKFLPLANIADNYF